MNAALRRQKEADLCEFETSLVYMMSSRPVKKENKIESSRLAQMSISGFYTHTHTPISTQS